MTTITIYRNHSKEVTGFDCSGHAGFDDSGKDIVCAAVSMLVINTINSIENFTDAEFSVDEDEEFGVINYRLKEAAKGDVALLIKSMILGLTGIQKDYGNDYIILRFKEV